MFTPISWLGEQVSKLRVGGKQLRSRVPTDRMPTVVVKAGVALIILVLFVDEFVILAAVFGGPIAFALLAGFALAVYAARYTPWGRRTKRKGARAARKVTTGRDGKRFDRRKGE